MTRTVHLKKTLYILVSFMLLNVYSIAQDITNSGKEFWFAFPETLDKFADGYFIHITSNTSSSGVISIPGTGFIRSFSISAGTVQKIRIPATDATIIGSDTSFHRSIHISSTQDVVVFAVSIHSARNEATLVLPDKALGKRYRVMTHDSEIKSGLQESEFIVVAGTDTVMVEITPKGNVANGANVNVPYSVTILPGHVYQAQARANDDDLTGSLIVSKNDKKFSVYAGNVWSSITCNGAVGNSDPLNEVMYPTTTWGSNYFCIPTPTVGIDSIRIVADEDSTVIFKDGNPVDTLLAGEYHGDTIRSIHNYTASKPVLFGQFLYTGAGQTSCVNNTITDPSMMILNPTEQMFLDSISFVAIDTGLLAQHFVHVLVRTSDTGRMVLDGTSMSGFTPFAQDGNYAYQTTTLKKAGYHRLETSGCGFIAYSLGIGSAISYAYATGASLVDLSTKITYSNSDPFKRDTICLNDTIQFTSVIKGNPLSFYWDFGDGDTSTARNPLHSYSKEANYKVTAMVEYSCRRDTIVDTIIVPPPPVINLGPDTILCQGDTLKISANTREFKALWNSGSTDSSLEISKSGLYHVTVSNFCGSDNDSITVVVLDSLSNIFLGPDKVFCSQAELTLTISPDSGASVKWDNGSTDSVRTVNTGGNYWVETKSQCDTKSDTILVTQKSDAGINAGGTIIHCSGDSIQLGGNPTAPPKSLYAWKTDGELNNPSISNPVTYYTLNRVYYLRVQDSSGCEFLDSAIVKRFTIGAEAQTSSCANDSAQLVVKQVDGNKPFTYSWKPEYNISNSAISNPKVAPDSSYTYTLVVSDSLGCIDSVRVQVPVVSPVKSIFDLNIQADCEGALATTNNQSLNASSFKWYLNGSVVSQDYNARITIPFNSEQQISLVAMSTSNCKDSSIALKNISAFEDYYSGEVPNVFTPNNDGINDLFDVQLGQRLEKCSSIKIYSRWGELIFESIDNQHVWDGRTFSGVECVQGVYFYVLDVNGTLYKGHVTLLR